MRMIARCKLVISLCTALCAVACGDSDQTVDDEQVVNNTTPVETNNDSSEPIEVPSHYAFESRLFEDTSSVSYSGQSARQVQIASLTRYIGGPLQMTALTDTTLTDPSQVVDSLLFYYEFDAESYGGEPIPIETDPTTKQESYGEISTSAVLVSKTAGNDDATDHKDWDGGGFQGLE